MRDRNVQFLGDNRAIESGVDVADQEHAVGAFSLADVFKCHRDLRGLLSMAVVAAVPILIWARDSKFLKENVTHLQVAMLGCTDDLIPEAISRPMQRPHKRGDLHKAGLGVGYQIESLRHQDHCQS